MEKITFARILWMDGHCHEIERCADHYLPHLAQYSWLWHLLCSDGNIPGTRVLSTFWTIIPFLNWSVYIELRDARSLILLTLSSREYVEIEQIEQVALEEWIPLEYVEDNGIYWECLKTFQHVIKAFWLVGGYPECSSISNTWDCV